MYPGQKNQALTGIWTFLTFLTVGLRLGAQHPDSSSIAGVVFLDSITVTAVRQGWDLNQFILKIKNDQTLYEAFRNLRTMSYQFDYNLSASRRQGKHLTNYSARAFQSWDGQCRTMSVLDEKISGPWKDRHGDYTYFSATLVDRLFLTHGRICTDRTSSPPPITTNLSGREKYINLLKKILFNPGSGEDIPILGREFELFDISKSAYYEHSIRQIELSGQTVLVIRSVLKKGLKPHQENKNIVRELVSYMLKNDNQIIYRTYHLINHSIVLDCDVNIAFEVGQNGEKYFVKQCHLQGYWNFPGKKWEKVTFNIAINPQS